MTGRSAGRTSRDERIWQALAGMTVLCLSLITAVVVRREFFPSPEDRLARYMLENPDTASLVTAPTARASEAPVPVTDWEGVATGGHRIGPANAPVTVVVFSDYECSFCARFQLETVPALLRRFPTQVAFVFKNWPLNGHRFAYSAARAAECAAAQGRFEAFHVALFEQRDSLGIKSYARFAREAGVPDAARFDRCANARERVGTIDAEAAQARAIGGRGTPTIVVNGLRLRPPYDADAIGGTIQSALAPAPASHP